MSNCRKQMIAAGNDLIPRKCPRCGISKTCALEAPESSSAELAAAVDDALDLVTLPPIRVPKRTHALLTRIAEEQGLAIQAVVRDLLESGEVMGARQDVPEGYMLVMVPEIQPQDEPDWDECIRQAEVATGLKVERNTLSIVIREVRRWLAGRAAGPQQSTEAWIAETMAGPPPDHPAWEAGPQQAVAWIDQETLDCLIKNAHGAVAYHRWLSVCLPDEFRGRTIPLYTHPAPAVERGVMTEAVIGEKLEAAGLPMTEASAECDAAQAIFWRNLNGGPISAQDAYRAGWFGHATLTATGAAQGDGAWRHQAECDSPTLCTAGNRCLGQRGTKQSCGGTKQDAPAAQLVPHLPLAGDEAKRIADAHFVSYEVVQAVAKAVLAAPAVQPLTPGQITAIRADWINARTQDECSAFYRGFRAAEHAHGIQPAATKGAA